MKRFENVAKLKLARLRVGDIVRTKGYYTPNDGGGAEYLIVSGITPDGFINHSLASNQAQLIHSGEIYAEQAGLRSSGLSDDAFDAVALDTSIKTLICNGTYTKASVTNFTRDYFQIRGKGTIQVDDSVKDTQSYIVALTGDYQEVHGVLFDGRRDNTTTGQLAPTGSMVFSSGEYLTWNARTANAQGYALTINGKNPHVISHQDDNSAYSGIRFNPTGGDWDYVKAGVIKCTRVTSSTDDPSTRGIVFNNDNSSSISSVSIEQYIGRGTDILLDAESSVPETGTPYFGHVKIGILDILRTIDSGFSTQSTTKFENLRSLTIGVANILVDDSVPEHQSIRIRQITDFVNIGTLRTNRKSQYPTGVPVTIQLAILEDGGLTTANTYMERADQTNVPIWLHVETLVIDSSVARSSSKTAIGLRSVAGNRVRIGNYINKNAEITNAVGVGFAEPNAVIFDTPNIPQQVSSSFLESITQMPRVIITPAPLNMTGDTARGDIALALQPSANGKIGQVTTGAGTFNGTATVKDFGVIDA